MSDPADLDDSPAKDWMEVELPPGYEPDLHAPDLPLDEIDDAEIEEAPADLREAWRYPFNPHPKQRLACSYLVDEMLFGGSAGPGKLTGHWQNA